MSKKTTKQMKTVFKVRFLRPVKMDGRWFSPGEEVPVSASIARSLLDRSLVEKVKIKTSVSSSSVGAVK